MTDNSTSFRWPSARAVGSRFMLAALVTACALAGLAAGWFLGFAVERLPAYPIPGAVLSVATGVAAFRLHRGSWALFTLLLSTSLASGFAWLLLLVGGIALSNF